MIGSDAPLRVVEDCASMLGYAFQHFVKATKYIETQTCVSVEDYFSLIFACYYLTWYLTALYHLTNLSPSKCCGSKAPVAMMIISYASYVS